MSVDIVPLPPTALLHSSGYAGSDFPPKAHQFLCLETFGAIQFLDRASCLV